MSTPLTESEIKEIFGTLTELAYSVDLDKLAKGKDLEFLGEKLDDWITVKRQAERLTAANPACAESYSNQLSTARGKIFHDLHHRFGRERLLEWVKLSGNPE